MNKRKSAKLYNRNYNRLFDGQVTKAQWNFLKLLAVADRQQVAVDGQVFTMCERLEEKGFVKTNAIGFARKRGGFVQMTDKGSALVARGMSNVEAGR